MYPDGKPVPGAEVVIQSGPRSLPGARPEAGDDDGARKAVAGADGAFAFQNLRVGTYLLAALHDDDVAPTAQAEVAPNASDVTLVMYPGAALEVTVRSAKDRTPLAGAAVKITDGDRAFGEQWSFRTATTDANGVAKFRGMIATANHLIDASLQGYAEKELAIHDFDFADRTWKAEILLQPAARVSGRVVDVNGKGVANATVAWEPNGEPRPADTPDLFDPFPFHGHIQAVQTDPDGRFALSAEPGQGCVLASHPGHELGEVCNVTIAASGEKSGIEIVLRDGGAVSGQVLWSDGTPAAGATVIATKRGWIHQPMQSKSYRFEARTDMDGHFAFRGIKRGALDLTAYADDASSPLVPIDLSKRAEQRDVKIQLSFEGTIRGRVVDEAKNPVANAVVEYFIDPNMAPPDAAGKPRGHRRAETTVQHPDFALPKSIGATRAGADGTFELHGLPDGMYDVKASRPYAVDLPTAYTSTVEQAVALGETVEIVLKGLGGVKGRVVSDTGRPVPAFGIALAPYSAKLRRDQFAVTHRILSGDGTFALNTVPAGRYRLRVDGEDVAEQVAADAITIAPGKVVDVGTIKVTKGVRRHGVVLAKDRKPAGSARITAVVDANAEPILIESDDDGNFTLPPLPPDLAMRMRADKYNSTSDWIAVPPGTATIELVLSKEGLGSISGLIVEANAPLDRRSIVLTVVGQGTPDDKLTAIRNTLSGEGGTFKFDSVPTGEYLVWVRRSSRNKQTEGDIWWKQDAPIKVEAQRETQVVLAVPPSATGSASDLPGQAGSDTGSSGSGSGNGGGGKQ